MDPLASTLFIIETVILIAIIAFEGISIFKKHKGQTTMGVEDLLKLQDELCNYAEKVYSVVSEWSDMNPANFESTDAYKEFLIKRIMEDFDVLMSTDPDCIVDSALYKKLTEDDRYNVIKALVSNILLEKLMKYFNSKTYNQDDGSEYVDSEIASEDYDGNLPDTNATNYVDIGEHLM